MNNYNRNMALIIDSHRLFTDSFSLLLERYTRFVHCHAFNEGRAAIDFLLKTDIKDIKDIYVFLEYYQEQSNGLALANEIWRISRRLKIIFTTDSKSKEVIKTIKHHQPNAIMSKRSGLDILLECIRTLQEGKVYYCPIIRHILDEEDQYETQVFTARELEILEYFSNGYTIDQTAEAMFLSRHTVVAHRRNMMKKAHCSSMAQLINLAKNTGLLH